MKKGFVKGEAVEVQRASDPQRKKPMTELPSVTIEGELFYPALIRERTLMMTEEHLAALLAAFPAEQLRSVLVATGREALFNMLDEHHVTHHRREALLATELIKIKGVLVHGARHCRCDACEKVLDDPDEFPEWQHTGCGGLVREYVERRPILQATERATLRVEATALPTPERELYARLVSAAEEEISSRGKLQNKTALHSALQAIYAHAATTAKRPVTEVELEVMRHALGVQKRGSKWRAPYRNHFGASGDHVALWDGLVASGHARLASKGGVLSGGDPIYQVTEAGKAVALAGLEFG